MADTFEELIAQIKDKLDIVDVVSESVILKKSGTHYWGLCPFHKEKTPSFSVNPKMGIYKCFGCGEGGDALTFLMKTRHMEFMPLVKELAEKFNIEMPENMARSESKDLKEQMIKATGKAVAFYNDLLVNRKNSEANYVYEYLQNRGITSDIIKEFNLGLAPKTSFDLYNYLKSGFSDEVLEKAGLIIKPRGENYVDRFRNRLIIPIQNEFGDYVAFGARAIEDEQTPKYLNSSDSLIYNKSKLLYGLYNAREAIKAEDSVILMEGYFDVISAQAHGIKNAVAACGTSLTLEHIKLLSRYTRSRRIFLSFDTDSAGQNATSRGAKLIKEAFAGLGSIKQFDESYISTSDDKYACEIRVIAPPEGKDPDEFIRSVGADSFKKYIEHAPLLIDFQINNILKEKHNIKTPHEKTRLVKDIIPILQEIKNEIILSEYIKMVAGALDLDELALTLEVKKAEPEKHIPYQKLVRNVTKSLSISEKAQKNLLSIFLVSDAPVSFDVIKQNIGDVEFTNQMLIIVKSTIDKLTCTVNNVKELIDGLYTQFVENSEIQTFLTDLVSISETFSNLSEKDFLTLIQENVNKIRQCQRETEKEKLRNLYKSANDDDTEALKIQMQLRDKINKRLKIGENE